MNRSGIEQKHSYVADFRQQRKSHIDLPRQSTTTKNYKKKEVKPIKQEEKREGPIRRVKNITPMSTTNKIAPSKMLSPASKKSPRSPKDDTPDSAKFGFSTLEHKKLQIIKSARALHTKTFLEAVRTMPNRFYTNVLKCFLHILRELRGGPLDESEVVMKEHEEVMNFVKDRHFKLMKETQSASNRVQEMPKSDLQLVLNLKKEYFHKYKYEKDLHKYCQKSKEIRQFLSFIFAVFNFSQEALDGCSVTARHTAIFSPSKPLSATKTTKKLTQKVSKEFGSEQKPKHLGSRRSSGEVPYPAKNSFSFSQNYRDEKLREPRIQRTETFEDKIDISEKQIQITSVSTVGNSKKKRATRTD